MSPGVETEGVIASAAKQSRTDCVRTASEVATSALPPPRDDPPCSLAPRGTAVDADHGAAHVRRALGGEEHDDVGDFLDRRRPAEGKALGELFPALGITELVLRLFAPALDAAV